VRENIEKIRKKEQHFSTILSDFFVEVKH